jgi:hypothetical protein
MTEMERRLLENHLAIMRGLALLLIPEADTRHQRTQVAAYLEKFVEETSLFIVKNAKKT